MNKNLLTYSSSSKKRNKHKKKHSENQIDNNGEAVQVENSVVPSLTNPINTISIKELKAAMEVFSLSQKPAKTSEEALKKTYQFWNTQPVPKMGKIIKWYQFNV